LAESDRCETVKKLNTDFEAGEKRTRDSDSLIEIETPESVGSVGDGKQKKGFWQWN